MKENKKKILDESAKYLIDISKLVFGGVILSGIMKQSIDPWLLYGIGIPATLFAFMAGIMLYNVTNK